MRRYLLFLCLVGTAFAQQPPAVPPNLPDTPEILTELQTRLDARKAKVGDPVRLKLLHALLAKGKIAVPEGATLSGHITEATVCAGTNPESRLAFVIERAEWKRGSIALHAVVVRQGRLVRQIAQGPSSFGRPFRPARSVCERRARSYNPDRQCPGQRWFRNANATANHAVDTANADHSTRRLQPRRPRLLRPPVHRIRPPRRRRRYRRRLPPLVHPRGTVIRRSPHHLRMRPIGSAPRDLTPRVSG